MAWYARPSHDPVDTGMHELKTRQRVHEAACMGGMFAMQQITA